MSVQPALALSANWASCPHRADLAGTWALQGTLASGVPFYAQSGSTARLFYDVDCDNSGNNPAAWILGGGSIDASRSSDVDGDGTCYMSAYLLTSSTDVPLGVRPWQMYCFGVLTSVDVTLAVAGPSVPPSPPSSPLPPALPLLSAGDCMIVGISAFTNGKDFGIVLLAPLAQGEIIWATDASWSTATTSHSFLQDYREFHIMHTAVAEEAAGTVLTLQEFTYQGQSAQLLSSYHFLKDSGEQLIVYRGSQASPNFLCALDYSTGGTILACPGNPGGWQVNIASPCEGQGVSVMAVEAVRGLLEKTKTKPEEIDAIICATITPDLTFPATANLIAEKVGAKNNPRPQTPTQTWL